MIAEKSLESYASLPESAKTVIFAFTVMMDRIARLSEADRDDLFELVMALPKCEDDEERASIHRAALEILSQEPVRVRRMDLAANETPALGLQKWAEHAGAKIKELRLAAGMKQEELAAKSGLTQSHISRLERGEHSPNHLTVAKIASALGVEVGQIDPTFE